MRDMYIFIEMPPGYISNTCTSGLARVDFNAGGYVRGVQLNRFLILNGLSRIDMFIIE